MHVLSLLVCTVSAGVQPPSCSPILQGFAAETFVTAELPPEPAYVRDMVFETKDGLYITCGAVQDKEWVGLAKALRRPDWCGAE